jgi:hypothetical protein
VANTIVEEMTGRVFGRWTVLSRDLERQSRFIYWICRCSCPAQTVRSVQGTALRTGSSLSCGCYMKECVSKAKRTHGMKRTPSHNSWSQMLQRCHDTGHHAYSHYGGRGIKVCGRWKGPQGFLNFLADLGERPTMAHTLDRHPDKDGDYCPENCRWATKTEQAQNRRDNLFITLEGRTLTVTDWTREGYSPSQLLRLAIGQIEQLKARVGAPV